MVVASSDARRKRCRADVQVSGHGVGLRDLARAVEVAERALHGGSAPQRLVPEGHRRAVASQGPRGSRLGVGDQLRCSGHVVLLIRGCHVGRVEVLVDAGDQTLGVHLDHDADPHFDRYVVGSAGAQDVLLDEAAVEDLAIQDLVAPRRGDVDEPPDDLQRTDAVVIAAVSAVPDGDVVGPHGLDGLVLASFDGTEEPVSHVQAHRSRFLLVGFTSSLVQVAHWTHDDTIQGKIQRALRERHPALGDRRTPARDRGTRAGRVDPGQGARSRLRARRAHDPADAVWATTCSVSTTCPRRSTRPARTRRPRG